jgi:predicted nucleotidyltransferase
MIHYSRLPNNIDDLLPEAYEYLRADKDILFAYLFGSLARKKAGPLSDVDIAVYCEELPSFPEKKLEILGNLYSRFALYSHSIIPIFQRSIIPCCDLLRSMIDVNHERT